MNLVPIAPLPTIEGTKELGGYVRRSVLYRSVQIADRYLALISTLLTAVAIIPLFNYHTPSPIPGPFKLAG